MNRPFRTSFPVAALFGVLLAAAQAHAVEAPLPRGGEPLTAWPYFHEILLPDKPEAIELPWTDFVLLPSVFDKARFDLADLRLYDESNREIPYALRVRRPEDRRDAVEATIFNRARGPEDSTELSLDLGPDKMVHNEVELQMPGMGFRRRAVLEASDDSEQWRELARENLVRFQAESGVFEDRGVFQDLSLKYPPSRFRYLRLRVYQDPLVDEEPPEVTAVAVYRTVEVPGEMLTLPASLGPREATNADGAFASAWIIDLGGENVPVEQIAVEIVDADFVRNYQIEAGGPEGSQERFRQVHSGVWRRRAGEEPAAMKAEFPEVRAARLRLVVIDHRNPPLDVRSVAFSAPARQVVFATPQDRKTGLRLYYGNMDAEAPFYDFARNLPDVLTPPPARGTLGQRQPNPVYVPEPLPLTERWPWLIYVVLGSVSAVLGAIVVNVAGKAIAVHDADAAGEA